MKNYYIKKNKQYYNKAHGWVDHKNFATKLIYDEAQALIKYYTNDKLSIAM